MSPRDHRAAIALAALAMTLLSCAGKRPSDIGVANGRLAPCPSSPNCVSSEADDRIHGIPAFNLATEPDRAWSGARKAVLALPRTVLVVDEPGYLHAEGNSDSHMKASLVGSSATVIIEHGELVLGQWQGIYFCEFDGPRNRHYFEKIDINS